MIRSIDDSTHTDMNSLPQVMFNDQLCPVDVKTNSVIVPMRIPLESISLPSRQQPTVNPRYASDKPVYQLPWSKRPQRLGKDKRKRNEVNPFRLFEPSQATRSRNSRARLKSMEISQTVNPGIHVVSPIGIKKHLQLADPSATVPPTVAACITNPVQNAWQPKRGFRGLKPYQKSDIFTIHKLSSRQQITSHQGQLVVSPSRIYNQIPHTRSTVPTFVPVNQQGPASQFFEQENKISSYHPIQTHQEQVPEIETRNVFSDYGFDTCGYDRNVQHVKALPYCHGIPPGQVAPVFPLTTQQPAESTAVGQQWKALPVYRSSEWEREAVSIYPSERECMVPPVFPTPVHPSIERESMAPCIYPFTKWERAFPPGYPAMEWEQRVPSVSSPDEYMPVAPTYFSAEWGCSAERPVSVAARQTAAENTCVQDQLNDVTTEVRKETLTNSSDCSRLVPCPVGQLSSDLDLADATSMALIVVTMGDGSFIADDIFPHEYRAMRCELDSVVEKSRPMEAFSVEEHDVNDDDIVYIHNDIELSSESSIDSDADVDSDNRSNARSTSRPWRRNVTGPLRWVKGQQHDPVTFGRKCCMGTRGDLDISDTTVDHTVDYILGLDCPLAQFVEP
ncbi:uncharacterized protein [Haliotis asinina]|uniref:uncharacterized protein n=1 Tax=Haliotis asinina TaxID=109174 RepID=UPI00353230D6